VEVGPGSGRQGRGRPAGGTLSTVRDALSRHLTFENLDLVWSGGHPVEFPVSGLPPCAIRVDPTAGQVTIRTPYTAPEPDVRRLRNLTFDAVVDGEDEYANIIVGVPDGAARGVYAFVTTVVDELQLGGRTLADAVAAGVARHGQFLAARSILGPEAEVGLTGELLVLRHLMGTVPASDAVRLWQGPLSGPHDFTVAGLDLEVKTTTSGTRSHIIHGLGQLTPVLERELWLVSIQVTRSSPDTGTTLTGLVNEIRTLLGGASMEFNDRLEAAGWHDDDADLFTTSWALRTMPRAYAVDGTLPAITREVLVGALARHDLVSEVTYRLDVTSLPYIRLPGTLGTFVESQEQLRP
jgi:hypothetical protein